VTCAFLLERRSAHLPCAFLEIAEYQRTECRRFCVGRSLRDQQRTIRAIAPATTGSIPIAYGLQNSVEFNNRLNLVRDQGVGGSNPLSPTNLFHAHNSISVCRGCPLFPVNSWEFVSEFPGALKCIYASGAPRSPSITDSSAAKGGGRLSWSQSATGWKLASLEVEP
jgi:hypothetical protein